MRCSLTSHPLGKQHLHASVSAKENGLSYGLDSVRPLHLAERVGFEPTVPCGTPDFESGTFGHSATSPVSNSIVYQTDVAPTLPTSCGSLPPEGPLRLRPGKAGSAAPAGVKRCQAQKYIKASHCGPALWSLPFVARQLTEPSGRPCTAAKQWVSRCCRRPAGNFQAPPPACALRPGRSRLACGQTRSCLAHF
jgi:hypothetical protein